MNGALSKLTSPLLGLVAINLLPNLFLRPYWSSGLAIGLLLYRFWLERAQKAMPPRVLIWTMQFVMVGLVWWEYRSFLGDEAGGTLLTLLVCLKVFELKGARDYFFTIVVCFLVLMSYLLLDQSLLLTGFMLVDVGLMLLFMMWLEDPKSRSYRLLLKPVLVLSFKSVPLLLLVFVLFPRFSTGFGTGDTKDATTGITDQLRPGSVAALLTSERVIFRATFPEGKMPLRQNLYWRAAILDISDGLNWDRKKAQGHRLPEAANEPSASDIEIFIETGSEKFLFALENTYTLRFPNEDGRYRTQLRPGNIFELTRVLQNRERYYIQLHDEDLPTEEPQEYLATQTEPSAELNSWLSGFKRSSDQDTVEALLNAFNTQGYQYSLTPPRARTLEEFLLNTKIGFCEHFAGAMASSLRHLNVPARVVVGFQGGTPSFLENYVTVRALDAHAWVEYYDRQRGKWFRADPTALVAPTRLSDGSDSYFAD